MTARRTNTKAREAATALRNETERTCVVCRAQREASGMVRLAVRAGGLVLAARGKERGVSVCLARACLEGLAPKVVSKVTGLPVSFELCTLLADLHAAAEARVLEMVGLARRTGTLVAGVDEVHGGEGGTVILAEDLAARGERRLPDGRRFVSGARLGHAAGMGYLGALRIPSGPLSEQAATWLSLWYESRPSGLDRGDDAGRFGSVSQASS